MNCEWIGWCALDPVAQAAWLQAVGSLLAVVAAFVIPTRIAAKARKRDHRRETYIARAHASSAIQTLAEVIENIGFAKARLMRVGHDPDDMAGNLVAVPLGIESLALSLEPFPAAGQSLQLAIQALRELRVDIKENSTFNVDGGLIFNHKGEEVGTLAAPRDIDASFKTAFDAVKRAQKDLLDVLNQG